MRIVLGVCTALFFSLFCTAAEKPNVILFYADDLGSVDLNCYGATDLKTPHLDELARRGTRFTQFYAAAPVCSPSRGALLTGRYPQRNGVNTNGKALKDGETTIAEMLKPAGYATALIGKWHLGHLPGPRGEGFDYFFGHMEGCIDNYSHFYYWAGPNRHDLHRNNEEIWRNGEYFPEMMVKETIDFIEKNKQRPFFIYFAINLPHYPLQATEKWRKEYEKLSYPRNLYAACVSTADEKIGEVIAALEKAGLREKTVLIFQSDHGHSTEERTHNGGGSAGPYRGAKFSLFEGGIRVPAVISWPGKIPENAVRHQFATNCDWLPTLSELCGVPLPAAKLDGRSLVPVIHSPDAPSAHERFFWLTGSKDNPLWAVREGDWKLLGNPRDTAAPKSAPPLEKLFLVNVSSDPGEQKNVAQQKPEIAERLKAQYEAWAKEVEE